MVQDIFKEGVLLSAMGGFSIQLLSLLEILKLHRNQRPDFRSFVYWIPYIINPFLGGLLGYAYFHNMESINEMLAIHIGASAPITMRMMITVIPQRLNLSTDTSPASNQSPQNNT